MGLAQSLTKVLQHCLGLGSRVDLSIQPPEPSFAVPAVAHELARPTPPADRVSVVAAPSQRGVRVDPVAEEEREARPFAL